MLGIKDEVIRRCFFIVEFLKVDKIFLEIVYYFEILIVLYLDYFVDIGCFVFNVIKEEFEFFVLLWEDFVEKFVKRFYEYVGFDIFEWLKNVELVDNYCEEFDDEKREKVVIWFRRYFDEIYFCYFCYVDSFIILKDRVFYVLEYEFSLYFVVRGNEVIIKKFLFEVIRVDIRLDVYNFKIFCDFFNWDYFV